MNKTIRLALIATATLILAPTVSAKKALIIVDIQRDFVQGGSLEVPNSGNDYVSSAIALAAKYKAAGDIVIALQDFHPANHMSFTENNPGTKAFDVKEVVIPTADGGTKADQQVMWPAHCVQGTPGADLLTPADYIDYVIQKGKNPAVDSYSGVKDRGGQETGLRELLGKLGVTETDVIGIAYDVCVKDTVVDLCEMQEPKLAQVTVLEAYCRGVFPAKNKEMSDLMRAHGATVIDAQ